MAGTNAIWLAEHGFDVLGVDVSPLAVEKARDKIEGSKLRCGFAKLDFLAAPPTGGPFRFIFDRGCFHVFDDPDERSRFAEHVAAALEPGGLWLSLIGSTERPLRERGPPRRSAGEITLAIEPALEIVELHSPSFAVKTQRRGSAYRAGARSQRNRPRVTIEVGTNARLSDSRHVQLRLELRIFNVSYQLQ